MITNLIDILRIVLYKIETNYYLWIKTKILSIIADENYLKSEVIQVGKLWISYIFESGYSLSEFRFRFNNLINGYENSKYKNNSLNDFVESFDYKEYNYRIYITLKGTIENFIVDSVSKYKGSYSFNILKWDEFVREFPKLFTKHKLLKFKEHIQENNVLVYFDIKAYDTESAYKKVSNNNFKDFLGLLKFYGYYVEQADTEIFILDFNTKQFILKNDTKVSKLIFQKRNRIRLPQLFLKFSNIMKKSEHTSILKLIGKILSFIDLFENDEDEISSFMISWVGLETAFSLATEEGLFEKIINNINYDSISSEYMKEKINELKELISNKNNLIVKIKEINDSIKSNLEIIYNFRNKLFHIGKTDEQMLAYILSFSYDYLISVLTQFINFRIHGWKYYKEVADIFALNKFSYQNKLNDIKKGWNEF